MRNYAWRGRQSERALAGLANSGLACKDLADERVLWSAGSLIPRGTKDNVLPAGQKTGDFEQTVRAYSADLYRYAYWLCRDRFLAEDLVQEAFTRAWKSWAELHDLTAVKPWLITILRNEYARTFARKRLLLTDDDVYELEIPTPSRVGENLEVEQCIGQLPLTYREPLLLQMLGGYSCGEIAELLGTSEGAVMTRLTRARQALRKQYPEIEKRRVAI